MIACKIQKLTKNHIGKSNNFILFMIILYRINKNLYVIHNNTILKF